MSDRQYLIMFHGTSSLFDQSILADGFRPRPADATWYALNEDDAHLASFDGTYAALDSEVAAGYARRCSDEVGGEPRLFVLRVPLDVILPDEDEVHFAFNCHLAHLLGFDDMADEETQLADKPWSLQVAVDLIREIAANFCMSDSAIERAAGHLNVMMVKATSDWDGDLDFFHPDGNDQGWSSPVWVRHLTGMEGGLALYRQEMDQILRCMSAPNPQTAPAGFATFRGRITAPISVAETSDVQIVGFGNANDPFEGFARFDDLSDADIVLDKELITRSMALHQPTLLTI